MLKLEFVWENRILWTFKIQMDYPVLVKRQDLVVIPKKKQTCQQVDFVIPADHKIKIKKSKNSINT